PHLSPAFPPSAFLSLVLTPWGLFWPLLPLVHIRTHSQLQNPLGHSQNPQDPHQANHQHHQQGTAPNDQHNQSFHCMHHPFAGGGRPLSGGPLSVSSFLDCLLAPGRGCVLHLPGTLDCVTVQHHTIHSSQVKEGFNLVSTEGLSAKPGGDHFEIIVLPLVHGVHQVRHR